MEEKLVEVRGLCRSFRKQRHFWQREETFAAVRGADFSIYRGEILGLLGESGCGKSTIAKMLLGLIRPDGGEILYDGHPLQDLSEREFMPYRREIQMVFQNPFGCFDPRMKVRDLLAEPLRLWKTDGMRGDASEKIVKLCSECGLQPDCLDKYPGEFSGGQLQRLALVRALLPGPHLLVADEIVSALDVPIQNQILNLLLEMKEKYGLTVLFITHDLSVARRVADRVMVMKEGEILACGSCSEIMDHSENTYIRALSEASYRFRM